jgi:hypothetical protein
VAQRPDGKPAKTERVAFTRPAAERIAKAVRTVEAGNRDCGPLTFGARLDTVAPKAFRICTFTGAWAIDSDKTVTLRNQTTTPNTVSAMNLFVNLPDNGQRNCAIGRDGTAWYLAQWQWDAADVLSGVTLSTAALEFTRVSGVSLGTATTVQISITTCATATSS